MTQTATTALPPTAGACPLTRSRNVWDDIRFFLLASPRFRTLIRFRSKEDEEDYRRRILQRQELDLGKYQILNIHRIGINVPSKYVFEELMRWSGDSSCWPNHIARVDPADGKLENIELFLFGKRRYPFGLKSFIPGLNYIPLFRLTAIRIEHSPQHHELDNARYLLYKCSGGYPIGFFSMFVRTAIEEYHEKETSQLFLMVSFNPYGKESLSGRNLVRRFWEALHNRVTANIMNRFKLLVEWRFACFVERSGKDAC